MSFDLCGSYLAANEGYFEGFLDVTPWICGGGLDLYWQQLSWLHNQRSEHNLLDPTQTLVETKVFALFHITRIFPSHISTLWLSNSLNTNRMPKLCLGGNLEISRMLDKIIMELSFYKPRSWTTCGQNSLWQWNLFSIALMPWQKQSSAYFHTRKWKMGESKAYTMKQPLWGFRDT